jgi:hypothetical protein
MKINNDKLFEGLKFAGLKDEEIAGQLDMLKDLLLLKIIERMNELHPSDTLTDKNLTTESLSKYISKNFSTESFQNMAMEVIKIETEKYLDAITKNLAPEKKEEVISILTSSIE